MIKQLLTPNDGERPLRQVGLVAVFQERKVGR